MTRKIKNTLFSILSASALLMLAGCGKFGPLEPRAGSQAAPIAYGQTKPAEADSYTTPSVQSRPGRSDEILRRSARRNDDPFDLPPGAEASDLLKPEITPDDAAAATDAKLAPKSY
jgi:predicted small lipoprotein YifL